MAPATPERELETAVVLVLTRCSGSLTRLYAEVYPEAVAKGIPLHLTLLAPFAPRPALGEDVSSALRGFFADRSAPSFELTRIDEFPGVLYAAPEPAGALVELIRALASAFPETPPYRGAHPEPVPHVTLAEVAEGAQQERLGASLRSAAASLLPVRCEITYASLLEEREPRCWRESERFPFAVAR
jgi:2'-5' RNA ligase